MIRRRTALWTLAIATVAAMAAGALALRALVHPDRLIESARQMVRSSYDRDLRIENLTFRLFPFPHLHATRVAFANPPWASDPFLLEAREVSADLELLPLLRGRIRVKTLSLEGVKAALEEAEDGAASWQLRRPGAGSPAASAPPGDAGVSIARIRIRDVLVQHRARGGRSEPWHIEDARLDVRPGLRDVSFEAKVTRRKEPISIKGAFDDLSRLGEEGAVSKGEVEVAFADTRATLKGVLPIARKAAGHEFTVDVKSPSIEDVFRFLGFERGKTAPFALHAVAKEANGRIEVTQLSARLGALALAGDARIETTGKRPSFRAALRGERLDWLKTLADAGGTIKPPRNDGQVFHADPVAWRAFALLGNLSGTADIELGSLRLGNGLELSKVRARAAMDGAGRLEIKPFEADVVGGAARGDFRFDAPKKSIQANLSGDKLMLEQWFRQRGRKIPFSGGAMRLEASITMSGDTFRELAASVTGPVSIRMGKAKWASARAGELEEMMVNVLAGRDAQDIDFECVSANLRFRRGKADGSALIGARSRASQLITSGAVDLREETLDLRGRVQAARGVNIGIATLAGGLLISGTLAKPRIGLDPDDKPAILARAAAAIATTGATLLGEALLDAASRQDPCEAPFRR